MRLNGAVEMNGQAFTAQDLISVINVMTELKRSCDCSKIHEGAVV